MNIFNENMINKRIEELKKTPKFVPFQGEEIFHESHQMNGEECTIFFVKRNGENIYYNFHIRKI